ncbi:OmpH family outer membrane protein [Rapidithrix thailandica]|uniref:OmpH family outer membrane protein n=1 Tax=Rapidithrix thailandica TaxID=413964 RepID=A0AAW9SI01_9BACT
MKPTVVTLFLFFCLSAVSFGQRFGYIDTQVILEKMPEYQEAEKELDRLAMNWQNEIDQMKKQLDSLKENYQAEEILLTPELKKEYLAEIKLKEDELREFQSNTFGYEGLLFLKRQELMKPIQDKLFKAAEKVAKQKKLSIVFDKAGDLVMLYTDPRHNYTDYVLEELGLGDPADTPR